MHGFVPEARRSLDEAAAFLDAALEGRAHERVFDVLIVGAGLSGVGMACHLQAPRAVGALRHPGSARRHRRHLGSVPLSRRALGFRHVHARLFVPALDGGESDRRRPVDPRLCPSDRRRPWRRQEHSIQHESRLRVLGFGKTRDGRSRPSGPANGGAYVARFPAVCAGYYRYDRGHFPEFPGIESFAGRVVQPQFWPADLDYSGKRVLVIGSGATAVTIVPEMAKTAAGVTMLQRSPTYMAARPSEDAFANALRAALPAGLAYELTRLRNVRSRWILPVGPQISGAGEGSGSSAWRAKRLGPQPDIADFTPRYAPWDQRLCLVPDADFFQAVRDGPRSRRHRYDRDVHADGVRTASGRSLDADIVVVATGLELNLLGDVSFEVDGERIDLAAGASTKAACTRARPTSSRCLATPTRLGR